MESESEEGELSQQEEEEEGEDVSCMVTVDFDYPTTGSPCVCEEVKNEVWNIVLSYQPLSSDEIATTNPVPIIRHNIENIDNYQAYFPQQSTLPIIALIQRLSNPGESPETTAINHLPPANYICTLVMNYTIGCQCKISIRRVYF